MNPRCANDVPLNDRPPPSQLSPTSVCVMNASDRAFGVGRQFRRRRAPRPKVVEHGLERGGRRRGFGRDDQARPGDGEDRVALAFRQPVVDARGDRTELGGGGIRQEVLGTGGEDERDDVTRTHAARREPDRHFVGETIDIGVRQRPAERRDVGGTIREAAGGFRDRPG
jgi:hypothetical protein